MSARRMRHVHADQVEDMARELHMQERVTAWQRTGVHPPMWEDLTENDRFVYGARVRTMLYAASIGVKP